MQIQHKDSPSRGIFYIEDSGRRVAVMTYKIEASDKMLIDHTEVEEALRGKNIGAQLILAGVEFARMKKFKIIPLCPFAKSFFDKKISDFPDVLES